jgi:hypothetical protein
MAYAAQRHVVKGQKRVQNWSRSKSIGRTVDDARRNAVATDEVVP